MAGKPGGTRRQRGHIRRRGNSFQVLVYAGTDPLTGKPHYLTESTTSEAEARRILPRLLNQVDEQRNARTTTSAPPSAAYRSARVAAMIFSGRHRYASRAAVKPAATSTSCLHNPAHAVLRRSAYSVLRGGSFAAA